MATRKVIRRRTKKKPFYRSVTVIGGAALVVMNVSALLWGWISRPIQNKVEQTDRIILMDHRITALEDDKKVHEAESQKLSEISGKLSGLQNELDLILKIK